METLPIPEAAKRAGKSERTVRNWLRAGTVKAVRDPEGKRLVVVASLDDHLAKQGAAPPPQLEGLPELAAIIAKQSDELATVRKSLEDAQWQVGYLTAQLEGARQQLRLLEAGPVVEAAAEPLPEEAPEGAAGAESAPQGRWARFRAWWEGRR